MYLLVNDYMKIENDDIYSYNLTRNATPSSELALGGCCISSFNISFDSRPYKGLKFNNAKIDVYNDKEKRVGVFYVDTPGLSNHVMSFECTDILRNASVRWIGRSFPCTMFELYSNILIQIGISSKLTEDSFPCSSCIINESKNLMNMTCIDILSDIAEMNGGFFYIDENGELDFKTFQFENIKKYDENYIHEISNIEQITTTRRGVYLLGSENKEYSFGDTSNYIKISDNEVIKTLTNDNIVVVGNTILDIVKTFEYNAASVSLWQDDLECKIGDVISVLDIDGEYHSIIIHEISYSNNLNYCDIECYGDNIKGKATQETSSIENEEYVVYDEGHIGKGVNHQTIKAKQGTYTIVEKSVTNISYFSHVFLSLHVDFYYTTDKIIFFDLYANNKHIGKVQKQVEVGLNTIDCSFTADVDLDSEVCVYSCRVEIEEGCELIIDKSKAILSLIVENCKIDTIVASDQRFVEKYTPISNLIFNKNRLNVLEIYDSTELVQPALPIATGDMSRTPGEDNVMYTVYDDGSCVISGSGAIGKTLEGAIRDNYGTQVYEIRELITDVTVSGAITSIPAQILCSIPNLKNMTFNSTTHCVFEYNGWGRGIVYEGMKIDSINFGSSGTYEIDTGYAFANITIENMNGEEYITKMTNDGTFANSVVTSSLDFRGCEVYESNCLEGLTCPYVTLSKNITRVNGKAFINSKFDSVYVITNDIISNVLFWYGPDEALYDCHISTFIVAPDAVVRCSNSLEYFERCLATNKKIYVPTPYDVGNFSTLATDTYGNFEVIGYDESEYENILKEVWR